MHRLFLLLLLLNASFFNPLRADDSAADALNAKLRDALRNSMLAERDAQNQIVTLQAAQAQSDKDNADLKAQAAVLNGRISALAKQAASDRAGSDATIAGLKSQITDLTTQNGSLTASLEAWKKDDADKTALAASKEAARAELAGQVITLQRTVDTREIENLQLFQTGNEILDRYKAFSLGDALAAKEPFTGLARVKLQEQVQDYRDKLLDHVITDAPAGNNPSRSPLAKQSPVAKPL
jgi:chromosome segregation ATPase